ncbi:MAG: hypothetical protein IPO35_15070 [Uliginosibacterium sp.]|nr:hypothetical protein [Uliginosibacterium sp.]
MTNRLEQYPLSRRPVFATPAPRPWHTWVVCSVTGLAGLLSVIGASVAGIRLGVSLGPLYMLCLPGISWCALAFVIYLRSRHALMIAAVVFVLQRLLGPFTQYFQHEGAGLQHGTQISGRLEDPDPPRQLDRLGLLRIDLALLCLDYRERFATWLRERRDETPTGDELAHPEALHRTPAP